MTHDPLYTETATTLPVDFHSFRRAFNTTLATAGMNVQQAMHLAHHSDEKVHMRYVMNTPEMRRIPAAPCRNCRPVFLALPVPIFLLSFSPKSRNCRRLWRPNGDPSKNFTSAFVIDLERERKRRRSRELRVPGIVRLLDQAVEFQRLLDSGEVRFRADLARRTGLSAMRITQILALLRLAPPILDYIRALPPGTAERSVTERALRSFTHTDRASQLDRATRLFPGFARFARRTGS